MATDSVGNPTKGTGTFSEFAHMQYCMNTSSAYQIWYLRNLENFSGRIICF